MNYTAKQISMVVLDTLERSVTIAKQQGATFRIPPHGEESEVIMLEVLRAIHKAAANNLGQVLAQAIGDADL